MVRFECFSSPTRLRQVVPALAVGVMMALGVSSAERSVSAAPPAGTRELASPLQVVPTNPGEVSRPPPIPMVRGNSPLVVASGDVGACCYGVSGSCTVSGETSCLSGSGRFKGLGTECSEFSCTGACCFGASCSHGWGEGDCILNGGAYQGDGTLCSQLTIACPPATGACCFLSGCFEVTPGECGSSGRPFFGLGTFCWQVASCNPPVLEGACCFSDGSCRTESAARCIEAGGAPRGAGTLCFSDTCPGACCFSYGCRGGYAPFWCGFDGGSFSGFGTRCADEGIACPIGACCFGESCDQDASADYCASQGGKFFGAGASCKDVECRGACCTRYGECTQTGPENCEGTFTGRGSNCEAADCPLGGACCFDYSCSILTESACAAEGGGFGGAGTLCDGSICEGACCDDYNGICSVTARGNCDGTYQGPGTTCDAAECPAGGACCFEWGDCGRYTPGRCARDGGIFQGSGTICADAICPDLVGACCLEGGSCDEVRAEACLGPGGDFLGTDRSCAYDEDTGLRSCPGACCSPHGYCYETSTARCEGVFRGPGSSCAMTECPAAGACCFGDESCDQVIREACIDRGGSFLGTDRFCDYSGALTSGGSAATCPGACCAFSSSACIDLFSAKNCGAFFDGVYQGAGTRCTDETIECPGEYGACCAQYFGWPGYECLEGQTEFACALIAGRFSRGANCLEASCSATRCPGTGDCCVPHVSAGCEDPTCCRSVCGVAPRCCLAPFWWDAACVELANQVCGDGRGGFCAGRVSDLNGDGTIDLLDFRLFQNSFGR